LPVRVQIRAPARQPPLGVWDTGPRHGDDPHQFGQISTLAAPDACALGSDRAIW